MNRRRFRAHALRSRLFAHVVSFVPRVGPTSSIDHPSIGPGAEPRVADLASTAVMLFWCGEVTTGRGIDQILPHPGRLRLFESYARSALTCVTPIRRALTGRLLTA